MEKKMVTREKALATMAAASKAISEWGGHCKSIGLLQDASSNGEYILEAEIARRTPGMPGDLALTEGQETLTTVVDGVRLRMVDLKVPTREEERGRIRGYLSERGIDLGQPK
jgi:hypothetical protein